MNLREQAAAPTVVRRVPTPGGDAFVRQLSAGELETFFAGNTGMVDLLIYAASHEDGTRVFADNERGLVEKLPGATALALNIEAQDLNGLRRGAANPPAAPAKS